ncbi:MAG: hypothetical protein A2508_00280 [Candidatus Lambdaproteobacteria bacterium RIFOXYD12_FULL_49_8]|uniref:Antitoxin n=1 Tax=Candidatus Lambdaproteobacteria bacterium RIFOXYD2_FULL_50_16 TaxID=1817772 RepID=A0A1F6GDC1_9PROT|nr:MAG: hypothetical protein A2527_12415 [Candidatus Lambdaproteobacteria bacterium RIFOXYD2_FULL_50_16]OGG97302.1 MAG: hypothetical protein A2508_00280 [Candidatus Lambdaproteobacteria bacterium RIFOXYD12_FULL_49_8]
MRTNVTLDEGMLSELLNLTGARTKTAAVTLAVKEQIRRAKLHQLAGLVGKIPVDGKALAAAQVADQERDQSFEEMGKFHG